MAKRLLDDWTGSSRQRRSKSLCLYPSAPTPQEKWYVVPELTESLMKRGGREWEYFVTRRDLQFERVYRTTSDCFVFIRSGYYLSVPKSAVIVKTRMDGE